MWYISAFLCKEANVSDMEQKVRGPTHTEAQTMAPCFLNFIAPQAARRSRAEKRSNQPPGLVPRVRIYAKGAEGKAEYDGC